MPYTVRLAAFFGQALFKNVGTVDWDTLLFFYGAMMLIGAIRFIGYLDAIAHFLFGQICATIANIVIGLSSAFIDNGTLMFAVLLDVQVFSS